MIYVFGASKTPEGKSWGCKRVENGLKWAKKGSKGVYLGVHRVNLGVHKVYLGVHGTPLHPPGFELGQKIKSRH